MGAGERWRGRHHVVPHRPRLGPRCPVRDRRGAGGRHLGHPKGRLPARGRRVRRGGVRHQPPRGTRDGPAAAAAAGDVLGGPGARRHRPAVPARHDDRRVRRAHVPRLRLPAPGGAEGRRRVPRQRQRGQRVLRTYRLRLRLRGAGRHHRHRLLLLTRRPAPGLPVPADRRVRDGARGRCDGDGGADDVRGVLPAGRTGRRRALQGVRRRRRRHRMGGGRRRPRPGAPFRRPAPRPPRPRRDPGLRRQPGRRVQRPQRAQRARPAARHPPGPRERPPHPGRRRRRRGARHRNPARRPHRGPGPARHLRQGTGEDEPRLARLREVQHRAHPGGGRRRRGHQDGHGTARPSPAAHAARRPAQLPRRLVGRRGTPPHRAPPLARHRPPPQVRRVLLRHQRHQRPCGSGGSHPRGRIGSRTRGRAGPCGRS
ncbi:hypothetical protein SCHAM137S_09339 [Streptomyces chartreusis]